MKRLKKNASTNTHDLPRIAGHRPWTDAQHDRAMSVLMFVCAIPVVAVFCAIAAWAFSLTDAMPGSALIIFGVFAPVGVIIAVMARWAPLSRRDLNRIRDATASDPTLRTAVAAWVDTGLTLRRRDVSHIMDAASRHQTNEAYQALGSAGDKSEGTE